MSLVSGLISLLGAIESDAISVHEERCISIRNRNADCLRCAEACTSEAISYADNDLKIDPSACIGCGTCATACPTCAIEVRHPSDDELVKYVKSAIVASKGHPVIACETALAAADARQKQQRLSLAARLKGVAPAYDMAQICAVPCLGRIDESLLVGLGAYKSHDVTLVCGDCESCAHAPGGRLARAVAQSARAMLEAFGCGMEVAISEELPARVCGDAARPSGHAAGTDRREFFKSMREGAARVAADAVDAQAGEALAAHDAPRVPPAYQKVGEDGTLSHFVPSRRTRVYNYLKHIGEPVSKTVRTRIIGSLSIDADACDSCRMCAVFCPTGAIEKRDGEFFGIVHRPAKCVQCRLCEHICPKSAISISDEVTLEQFMGRRAVAYRMKEPTWKPNQPKSMYSKLHSVLGEDLNMCSF